MRIRSMSLIVALFSLAIASPVLAQQTPAPTSSPYPAPAPAGTVSRAVITAPQQSGFTLWGMLDWDGYGAGARFMFPLAIPSLLSRTSLRDSWALEAGVDFFRISDTYSGYGGFHYDEILPTVGMMWIVWLRDDFAVYPKIDGGYAIGFDNSYGGCGGACDLGGIRVEGAAGLLYKLPGVTLRAEVGNYGLKGGVAWLF
ncbi:MAG TPA: hypothetical protein VH374_21525 [Polyangia bacterium]|nr:hypothetical protein [Polyangia bacterium]